MAVLMDGDSAMPANDALALRLMFVEPDNPDHAHPLTNSCREITPPIAEEEKRQLAIEIDAEDRIELENNGLPAMLPT